MAGEGPAIEARGLVKVYGKTRALDGIDLTVRRGQVFGFLGPNGAGKTTTIRILATLTRPDGGTARVLGCDVVSEADAIRARVAVTGQFASLDDDLTGYENLIVLGRLRGLSRAASKQRADDLLAAFDLTGPASRPVGGYSGGMRRRLDIGASLIVTPDLLFLDEPTTGMDPRSRSQVWELVRQIAAAGTTVLLTTQYLEEADQLAGQIAVIDHGRIVAEGTSAQLKARVGSGTLHVRLLDGEQRSRARAVLADALEGPVQLGADPLTLSVLACRPGRPGRRGPSGRARHDPALAGPSGGRRSHSRPAQPARGVPRPHRPPGQPSRHRPRGHELMSTPTATTSRAVPEARRLDGLLAPSGPPRRAGALAASATFGWRAMLKIKHEPKQLTDVIAIPVLITVLFTYLFGGTISGSPGQLPQDPPAGHAGHGHRPRHHVRRRPSRPGRDHRRVRSLTAPCPSGAAPSCSVACLAMSAVTCSLPPSW